jgi:hypothetical protein
VLSGTEAGARNCNATKKANPLIKHLVTLRIHVYHMKRSPIVTTPKSITSVPSLQEEKINETALKGRTVTQFVKYGVPTPTTRYPRRKDNFRDPQGNPFAVFEFRYRTKG